MDSPLAPVPNPFAYFTDDEHERTNSEESDETIPSNAIDIDEIIEDFDYDVFQDEMDDVPEVRLRRPEDTNNPRNSSLACESEFRIVVKERVDGLPEICHDCFDLILHLQKRVPRRSMKWKTVPELLNDGAYEQCRLCELVASAPTIFLDELSEKDDFLLKPLREYKRIFTEFVDMAIEELTPDLEPIEVFGHVNGVERICEVSFSFEFRGRPAHIILAIWLGAYHTKKYMHIGYWVATNCVWVIRSAEPLPETEFDPLRRLHNPQPERCEGVRTGSDITWREPLTKNHSWRTFELFQQWMTTCLTDHGNCTLSLSGERIDDNWAGDNLGNTELPSRVLDVFEKEDDIIKLVETCTLDQKRAPYVTLSHCWGPPDKQPLTTTRENLQEHTSSGIPVSSFPKTFRDAIDITRQLDIQYLWIDSLCIVQDDEEDWLAESEKMGAIYHRAAVTIAASDANNSTEGCFVAERGTASHGHKVPTAKFVMRKGETGSIFKTCFGHVPTTPRSEPYFSPLGHRAWVCQEWYLSRRVIFCTKSGFMWKCLEVQHNERGRYLDMKEQRGWEHLMERYSESNLTRETDRLIAVQGIANELLKTENRKGQEYHYGHWTGGEDTAIMLCWMMKEWVSDLDGEGPTGVPSWSWASITGARLFCRTLYQFFLPCRTLMGSQDISVGGGDGKSLNIKHAQLRKVELSLLEDSELDCHPEWTDRQFWSPESLFLHLRRERKALAPIHVILSDDVSDCPGASQSKARVVGLAAFDRVVEAKSMVEIFTLPLVESPRFGLDPFLPPNGDMMWHGEDIGSQDKLYFMNILEPESGGSIRGYSAEEVKVRPPVKYNVLSRAGEGKHQPVGYYTPPSPEEAKVLQDSPDAKYVYDAGQGKSIFWALLLEPVLEVTTDVKTGSFRRVGMALIGSEEWLKAAVFQDIVIV
ncbi:Heterokaryon incompatibility protein (HET) domain containing protein [Naviculisporaceae sp. PSN 640]